MWVICGFSLSHCTHNASRNPAYSTFKIYSKLTAFLLSTACILSPGLLVVLCLFWPFYNLFSTWHPESSSLKWTLDKSLVCSKPCTPLHTFPLILSPFCFKSKFHTRATQSSFLLPLDLLYYPPRLLLHSHSGFPEVPRTWQAHYFCPRTFVLTVPSALNTLPDSCFPNSLLSFSVRPTLTTSFHKQLLTPYTHKSPLTPLTFSFSITLILPNNTKTFIKCLLLSALSH